MNLGGIYTELGNLDQALNFTLKSLELNPEGSQALCKLGLIKMALGQTKEAKNDFLVSIERNNKEYEAYYALSTMLKTTEDAEEVIDLMESIKDLSYTAGTSICRVRAINCYHKLQKFEMASKHSIGK